MQKIPIYTIGHGNRSIEDFIALLQRYDIGYLIDVRSQPYSRYSPQFSKEALTKELAQHTVSYVFMGDTLGGRPKDSTCYEDGKVVYSILKEKAFFQQGVKRLENAWQQQLRVALMCSETKPHECHRSKLIGTVLNDKAIFLRHIDENGDLQTQEEVLKRATGEDGADTGVNQLSLLPDAIPEHKKLRSSRKRYTLKT